MPRSKDATTQRDIGRRDGLDICNPSPVARPALTTYHPAPHAPGMLPSKCAIALPATVAKARLTPFAQPVRALAHTGTAGLPWRMVDRIAGRAVIGRKICCDSTLRREAAHGGEQEEAEDPAGQCD
jgi:hypothetical protein